MDNFELTKRNFLDSIKFNENYSSFVKKCLDKYGNYDDAVVIFNPKNERELRYSKIIYRYYSVTNKIRNEINSGNIKMIPCEESNGIKLMIELYKKIKEKTFDLNDYIHNTSMEDRISIVFDCFVDFYIDRAETQYYIASELGYNLDNFFSRKSFKHLTDQVTEELNDTQILGRKGYSKYTDEDIDFLDKFIVELFNKYVETKTKDMELTNENTLGK